MATVHGLSHPVRFHQHVHVLKMPMHANGSWTECPENMQYGRTLWQSSQKTWKEHKADIVRLSAQHDHNTTVKRVRNLP